MSSAPVHISHATSTRASHPLLESMVRHLSEALQFKTLSFEDPTACDAAAFQGMHGFLQLVYPKLHQTLRREIVGEFSLLYTWEGSKPELEPVLLLAHLDVVPAEDEAGWKYGPFSGAIGDAAVWGRGAMDVKGPLVAMCEAVESLIESGFRPNRTVYLAFGQDEEVGGIHGAHRIGQLLSNRGVRPLFISDEGGAITSGVVPGIRKPVALVGIAEKGYLSLALKVEQPGGHASMPPDHTAIGILSQAIHRIEMNPFPARVAGVSRQMLRSLAPHMSGIGRLAAGRLGVFEPIVRRQLLRNPDTAAILRTTCAATMFNAGVKDNILPQEASAILNVRTVPGDNSRTVISHVKTAINDPRVHVSVYGRFHSDPSPVAETDSAGFRCITGTIRQILPEAAITPFVVLGGTDSRHYTRLTPNVFRFSAMELKPEDLRTIHGNNEHLTYRNCELLMNFFSRLIENA
ncbi:MAG TPA: M20 family peptidase, partial [Tepidisphaeraceae bacterium]|nr:M20 family peptidase [Tepidisphaeraceae bacterium]